MPARARKWSASPPSTHEDIDYCPIKSRPYHGSSEAAPSQWASQLGRFQASGKREEIGKCGRVRSSPTLNCDRGWPHTAKDDKPSLVPPNDAVVATPSHRLFGRNEIGVWRVIARATLGKVDALHCLNWRRSQPAGRVPSSRSLTHTWCSGRGIWDPHTAPSTPLNRPVSGHILLKIMDLWKGPWSSIPNKPSPFAARLRSSNKAVASCNAVETQRRRSALGSEGTRVRQDAAVCWGICQPKIVPSHVRMSCGWAPQELGMRLDLRKALRRPRRLERRVGL